MLPPWSVVVTGITSVNSSRPIEAADPKFQDRLIARLEELTGVTLR